jgi:DNA modification methylase
MNTPLSVDPEFRSLIPPLRPDERAGLEASLRGEGCRDPIVIWKSHNIIMDGHNRFDICEAHKIPYKTTGLDLPDREAVKMWIRRNQLSRRNLTDGQRAAMAHRVLKAEAALARRERARKGGKGGGVGRPKGNSSEDSVSSKLSDPPKDRSRKVVAAAARVPERAVRALGAAEKAMAQARGPKAARELIASVEDGSKTVPQATAEAKRATREVKRQAELQARAASPGQPQDGRWEIRQGDNLEVLSSLSAGSVRLAFADPNYNLGIAYEGGCDDQQPRQAYLARCQQWISAVSRVLTEDGSLWVLIDDTSAAEFKLMLEAAGLHPRAWIIWYGGEFGQYSRTERGFAPTHRHLFWAVKDPCRFVFNPEFPEVRRPNDRQVGHNNDPRASPDGCLWGDTWAIPRLVGTSDERLPDFPTQLPLALLRPIVACASHPGDLVVDPFSGSATTGVACIELGRRFLGIELSQQYVDLSRLRLAGCRTKAPSS